MLSSWLFSVNNTIFSVSIFVKNDVLLFLKYNFFLKHEIDLNDKIKIPVDSGLILLNPNLHHLCSFILLWLVSQGSLDSP